MRTVKGWSQEEIAEKLHMSLNAYGCIERSETRPNLNRLEQLAQVLGIKLEELVSDKSILNIGIDFNKWYNTTSPSEQLIELQHELEKSRLLLEQKDKEIEYLKQQNADLRAMVSMLKPEGKSS